jgi:Sporulation and spore germination
MTVQRRYLILAGILVVLVIAGLGMFAVERFMPPRRTAVRVTPPPAPTATAHINATLFYGSLDGQALIPLRREVPLADGIVAQGEQILRAQLAEAPAPLTSVVPKGTTLRAFYVTDRGDAFVDLSKDVSTAHPGGTLLELMTVYSIVDAVTGNLPKVQRVQILVEGKAVDTIAGHVDVRRPLARDVSLVREK